MDTPLPSSSSGDAQREEARIARKKWEREKIVRALQQAKDGDVISGAELDRWIEASMATDDPVPFPRRPTEG